MARCLGFVVLSALAIGCHGGDLAHVAPLEEVAPGSQGSPFTGVAGRFEALSPDAQRAIESSRLPILLPENPALLASVLVTTGPHFVAWAAQGDGVHVSLHGTDHRWRVGTEAPPAPEPDQVRGMRAVVSQNEGIQTATWDEGGVAWALDLECAQAYRDARCAEPSYVRALAETLQRFTSAG